MKGQGLARRESGFTLVELLVVILVLAILAGIAIPVFLAQRNKARVASAQRSLKDAALAAESYGASNGGDYSGLQEPDGLTKLKDQGFNPTLDINIDVLADANNFCLLAQSVLLDSLHPWYWSTYEPGEGRPDEDDDYTCTDSEEEEEEEDPEDPPEDPLPVDVPTLPACVPPVLVPPLCE